MNSEIRIGIIEDEVIIAEKISETLKSIGYSVCAPVSKPEQIFAMIENHRPDLLLLDINLGGNWDGIDIADKIKRTWNIPFIFLTAYGNRDTIERAREVKPLAYIIKPFTEEDLFSSIEIAFGNYSSQQKQNLQQDKEYIFVREDHRFIKVKFDNIIFIESKLNYIKLQTTDGNSMVIRSTFSDFIAQLPQQKFMRVHRSFAVQQGMIEKVDPSEIIVEGHKIPLSKSYRGDLLSHLGIKI